MFRALAPGSLKTNVSFGGGVRRGGLLKSLELVEQDILRVVEVFGVGGAGRVGAAAGEAGRQI